MMNEQEEIYLNDAYWTPERLAKVKAFEPVSELNHQDLPPVIRIFARLTPNPNFQIANVLCALAYFMVMAPRLVFNYFYDGAQNLNHLLVQLVIVAQTSGGKSFSGKLRKLILKPLLDRDKRFEAEELEYSELKRTMAQNKTKPKEPITMKICLMKFTKNKIVKRAHMIERRFGEPLTFSIFTDELSTLVERRGSYGDLRDFGKLAYDYGSETSVDTNSDASYNATVDINWVSVYNSTPRILYRYLDKEAVESGNANRMTFITLGDMLGVSNPPYREYTEREMELISEWQTRLMEATYVSDTELQPLHEIPMKWLHEAEELWCDVQRYKIRNTLSHARDAFYKRASTSAARYCALLYYFWGENKLHRAQVKRLYYYIADYILDNQLMLFEQMYVQNMVVLDDHHRKVPTLYELMPPQFTRDQLIAKMKELELKTDPRQYVCNWKRDELIVELPDQKYVYRKIGAENK